MLETAKSLGYAGPNPAARSLRSQRAGAIGLVFTEQLSYAFSDRPTAIITVSDVLALGVLDSMRQRGITPGRDLSLAGFDDIPAAAEVGLTTVRQPIAERGRIAGRMLLDPEYAERQVVLPTELVVRSSTGPVPTSPTR